MLCEFCKEEIQSDAVVCRFCNAELAEGKWARPPQSVGSAANDGRRKGAFTIKFAGFFFLLSAILEFLSVTSPVSFRGGIYTGWIASAYHLFYGSLFIGMGAGLWRGTKWGLKVMLFGTCLYTIEKLIYLLDRETQLEELDRVSAQFGDLVDLVGTEKILQMTNLVLVLVIVCWWGFMAYLYLRRAYFGYHGASKKGQ